MCVYVSICVCICVCIKAITTTSRVAPIEILNWQNPSNNQLMRTFKYNGVKLWNALAISVRGKRCLNSFKGAYLKEFFTHR